MSACNINIRDNFKLASFVLMIYYPVLLYIDVPVYIHGGASWQAMIFHELINIAVVIVFLFVWMSIAAWMLNVLSLKLGEDFLLQLRIIPIATLVIMAFALAITFILATGEVLKVIDKVVVGISGVKLLVSFPRTESHNFFELFRRANIGFFILIMLSAFYLIANRRAGLRLNALTIRSERFEKEKTVAQLDVLRNQVNPHFLFNSLSILTTLVHENAALSEKFITELSRFYRYTLDEGKNDLVTLSTELAFIRSYLFLLHIRFGDKFRCDIDIDEAVHAERKVAPLTLQVLLENVVTHNQMSASQPLKARVWIVGDCIAVSNTVQVKTVTGSSTRIGLKNVVERYKLLTQKPVIVESHEQQFTVKIPLL